MVFAAYVGTILIVTGALTVGASAALVAPVTILRFLFGDRDPYSLTILITRHWGLLVALVGGLLIYAGYHSEARLPIMIAAIAEKLAIGVLIFFESVATEDCSCDRRRRRYRDGTTVYLDSVWKWHALMAL